jgi:hypothetical protein
MTERGERIFDKQGRFLKRLDFLHKEMSDELQRALDRLGDFPSQLLTPHDALTTTFADLSNRLESDPARVEDQEIDNLANNVERFIKFCHDFKK